MKPIAEIFSQGEEVVTGQTVDSNAAWLSQQLNGLGFSVKRHTAVGDNLADLVALIGEIANRADCCICTGGLGPTIDDLTAEAVSLASGQALQFDPVALAAIEQYYACRQRVMPPANRKQAMLPQGAIRIDNPVGTAPGFALQIQTCWFVFLPGVPAEMKAMFSQQIVQQLPQRFELQADCLVTLRSVGIGESAIQQQLQDLKLPETVQLGFRAAVDEVQTKLLFPADFPEIDKQVWVAQVRQLIGDYVFAIDGLAGEEGDLLTVIDRLIQQRQYSLALLETASQGLIAARCLGRNWLKSVSLQLASADSTLVEQLASQLQQTQQTDLALVQLYIGTASDYLDRQQAVVLYNALQTPDGIFTSQNTIAGSPTYKQTQAAIMALDLLRRYLQKSCL
ncbi:MAG: competence/damage-inducible protein A [Methylomonas sp.]